MSQSNQHHNEATPPLLRWAGSKKRQFNKLKGFFPATFDTYVEPFAGSASFLFNIRPKKARLNDINVNLFDFYSYAKSDSADLYDRFIRKKRTPETYYRARIKFNAAERGLNKTADFYFLNCNCFNGIFRVNKKGEFNVPFSDNRVSPYLTRQQFLEGCEVVKAAEVYNLDFEEFCKRAVAANDFVFLDPPYYRTGQRIFNEYALEIFTSSDFERLDAVLRMIHDRGAKFLLSFPRTCDSIRLAKSWNSATSYVLRTVAGDPGARRKQSEMLIYNFNAQLP